MHALTEAWARKAERDLATAAREMAVPEEPNYEAVCHHAHKAAVHYLRARLQEVDVPFPETSHLVVLLHLCSELEPDWSDFREPLRSLTHLGFRVDDAESGIGEAEAREALDHATAFGQRVRASLGLT